MTLFSPEAEYPFAAFRFQVDFLQPGGRVAVARGAFSECSGLEATMEAKEINEGGRNYGSAQRIGRVSFGAVVLKRGLTSNWELWKWFSKVTEGGAYAFRLDAEIKVLGPGDIEQNQPRFVWSLKQCLPTKFKAPDLNAASEEIAIEELHLSHEGLSLSEPSRGSAG